MPKTKKLCNEPLRPEPARLTPTESGNAQGSGDALLARLEHGKLPGFSCSINRSHQPPVWKCDTCQGLRCAACMHVYREACTFLCWNCARPLILQGCTSFYRVEEFYGSKGVKYWDFDADAEDCRFAHDEPALFSLGAAAVGADTPLGSSAHAAASGAPTDSRTASSADDAPVAALPLGASLLAYSDSWATVLQEYMMGQRLGNEEVTITDRNQKILILVDHEHAQPGEMECIPHPDQFPLLIVHKARAAVGQGVGKEAAFGQPVCPASRVSAAESARVSSWRRCEFCGWTVLPEHITGVCAVCCRSVACRRCERDWRRVCDETNWPAVCYTCGGTLAKGQPLHYTC